MVRRYDRDATLIALSTFLGGWAGNLYDANGKILSVLPWNVAGLATTLIGRGTSGGKKPSRRDIDKLTYMYFNLAHPVEESDPQAALKLITRFVYQQWPFTRQSGADWARPASMLVDTLFPSGYEPEVMKDGWERELLGTDVGTFVSVGFMLNAMSLGDYMAGYPFQWEETSLAYLKRIGGEAEFDAVFRNNFVATFDEIRAARLTAVISTASTDGARFLREPFAYNPLFTTPFVEGIVPGVAIAPCAPAIAIRASTIGIIYAGLQRWGVAFTHDVGKLFEAYVGRQLTSRTEWTVLSEICYGRDDSLSVDWFVITDRYVVLIECKSALPTAAVREGSDRIIAAHVDKLDKSVRQLNRSRNAILAGVPEFRSVPRDLPLVGLSVTLGNFEMANQPDIRSAMTAADFPVAMVGVDFLEWFVTLSDEELNRTLSEALSASKDGVFDPGSLGNGMKVGRNILLAKAFDAIPVHSLLIANGHVIGAEGSNDGE
jgi:hypothetical protein